MNNNLNDIIIIIIVKTKAKLNKYCYLVRYRIVAKLHGQLSCHLLHLHKNNVVIYLITYLVNSSCPFSASVEKTAVTFCIYSHFHTNWQTSGQVTLEINQTFRCRDSQKGYAMECGWFCFRVYFLGFFFYEGKKEKKMYLYSIRNRIWFPVLFFSLFVLNLFVLTFVFLFASFVFCFNKVLKIQHVCV